MLKLVANSDMRDEAIYYKARMTFIDHFTCSLKFAQCIFNKTDSSCFSKCQYVHETLMQKNNKEIIGNGMRIK